MYSKVLIANRGEIAVRVISTAKYLGYRTVAVYSEADSNAPHVKAADFSVCVGAAPVGESYLVAENILAAAKASGADAIHPGYGFLSENADFARACQQAGIVFIGPDADAIGLMGSKRLSKLAMKKSGVPCVPGYDGDDQNTDTLVTEGLKIGFPLMIKASAGGGGRGMRLVHNRDELASQLSSARSEAKNAFGSGELILEKALINPRHIEIQVFADMQGNMVYLGERDCSIQRRHQKVVEEAPSPFVDAQLRQAMGECAVKAAKSCHYVGAGTVEFLVDADRNYYFLEMNTRLQVEHPVTELISGIDLVAWQLNVAAGKSLPLSQDQIKIQGHAIEVRLYAEDPRQNFMLQTGEILRWCTTEGAGLRFDAGIETGQLISSYYDPMLAKLIAYGEDREQARRRLILALEDTVLFGVNCNQEFLGAVLAHKAFSSGAATTAFIEKSFYEDSSLKAREFSVLAASLAALLFYKHKSPQKRYPDSLNSWRNSNSAPWPFRLAYDDKTVEISLSTLSKFPNHFRINCGDSVVEITAVEISDQQLVFNYKGVGQRLDYLLQDKRVYLKLGACYYLFDDLTHKAAMTKDSGGSGKLCAVMDGAIIDVLVSEGDCVKKGQTLVVLEAMKMEHQLKADADGVVSHIKIACGDQVKIRQELLEIKSETKREPASDD